MNTIDLAMRDKMLNVLPFLEKSLDKSAEAYRNAEPFPHIVINDFLPNEVIDLLIEEFPKPESPVWRQRINDAYQLKLATNDVDRAPSSIRSLMYQLNSATILGKLEALTGEGPLISDPYYDGGGLHQIERGGHLAVHSDFTRPPHLPLYRRLNLLIYLNRDWADSFGGKLELWSRDGKEKIKEVAPLANRAVIFTTDTTSYHGHPTPLSCPPDRSRRSLALYYYSVEPPERDHSGTQTRWRLDATDQARGFRGRAASLLWRVSHKIGNIASGLETSAVAEPKDRG
jgi:Rps23 Pro-64 3,4-dihydroxylase Tpa1-like proline 4-hydroxylase